MGGPNLEISPIGRENGSGTRDGFESIMGTADKTVHAQELTSTGAVIEAVANNPNAIGYASLAAILVLSVMVLPHIISVSLTALNAVPPQYEHASLALGASPVEIYVKVSLRAASSSVFASIIQGTGRALGSAQLAEQVLYNLIDNAIQHGNTGLGLAIAKHDCATMRGHIDVSDFPPHTHRWRVLYGYTYRGLLDATPNAAAAKAFNFSN